MKGAPVFFIASRLIAGRNDASGGRDQARRALRGAVLAIGLSLVPLLTVMQVADGMVQGISARYVELGTYHAQAHAYSDTEPLADARDRLAATPGVTGAWIESQSVGVAFTSGAREGAAIRAVEQGFLDDPGTTAYFELEDGDLALERANDALVGSALAAKLGIKSGDSFNLITVRRSASGEPLPKVSILRVRGVVSAGYRELDSQWLFIRQADAARVLPRESTRSFVGVKSADPFGEPEQARHLAESALQQGYTVYSWKRLERNLFESLASTRTMLLLIMAVTVAVAAVNVSSALSTLVMERRQEIAVLKSLGARPSDLARTFSLGGAFLGAAGAVLGSAFGLLAATRINEILRVLEWLSNAARRLVALLTGSPAPAYAPLLDPEYYLQTIPITLRFADVAGVVILTVGLSFAASFLPARKAARLDPMDALRRR